MRGPGRYFREEGGSQKSDSLGPQNRLDVALWTLSLGQEPRREKMLTFVRFHGLGN